MKELSFILQPNEYLKLYIEESLTGYLDKYNDVDIKFQEAEKRRLKKSTETGKILDDRVAEDGDEDGDDDVETEEVILLQDVTQAQLAWTKLTEAEQAQFVFYEAAMQDLN